MKKTIILNESELKDVVKESVITVLNEVIGYGDMDNNVWDVFEDPNFKSRMWKRFAPKSYNRKLAQYKRIKAMGNNISHDAAKIVDKENRKVPLLHRNKDEWHSQRYFIPDWEKYASENGLDADVKLGRDLYHDRTKEARTKLRKYGYGGSDGIKPIEGYGEQAYDILKKYE